jgi:4-amino-4-deoxy-L-arabinose transferase-like glycosyltransferase
MRARAMGGVFAAALAARLLVVLWAGGRFPPTGDGTYYDTIARRIAHGDGYTWLWPDGAVTFAAHYPVGYPALLGAFYALFGASVAVAMLVNALVGAAGAAAMHRLALRAMKPERALAAGLVVALHPALVPYTTALMTEGVTASLLVVAAACAAAARGAERSWGLRVAAGVVMGVATLVRPQCLALAPVLGALSVGAGEGDGLGVRRRAAGAAVVLGLAVACCLPWTARNCLRMESCALVSVNGGWNLLIGAQTETGSWAEVAVPPACREIWGEAAKDECFGRAARETIARDPGAWLALAPAKLASTFDYIGASPWYMHASNPDAFDERAKGLHGGLETVVTRLLLGLALVASARMPGERRRARWGVAGVGLLFVVLLHAWVAYLALAVVLGLRGVRDSLEGPMLAPWTAALIVATAATHAVFFGAGRYGLVVLPFVAALAASLGDATELPREPSMPTVAPSTPRKRSPAEGAQAPRREESPSSTECDAG